MNITQSVISERDRALLGGDYETYHAQTVRKIHTLRRRLGTATPRGRKYTPKSPVTAQDVAQNREWVQLLLVSSERAWAHAMTMKSSQSAENTQKQMAGSTKKQIASRFRRAILYATNLVEILQDQAMSKSTPIDLLEAKAYLALLKGGLDFEKARWRHCIEQYSIAHQIYLALSTTSKADTFKDLISTTVEPSIRYAAYQSKLPRTRAVHDIAIENFPGSESEARAELQSISATVFVTSDQKATVQSDRPTALPTSISWRSRNVKIEDATISQTLGAAQDKESDLSKIFESFQSGEISSRELAVAFDGVIEARQDAVDATKNAIDELRAEGVDQGDPRVQSLQITRTAAGYAVIEWRVGRNRVLCGVDDGLRFEEDRSRQNAKQKKDGQVRVAKEESTGKKLSRLRERVTLYDSILQSIDSIKELPGVIADSAFTEELDGKRAYFRALKCLSIGRSQALEGNVNNALALFSHAHGFSQQSITQIKTPSPDSKSLSKFNVTSGQLGNLETHLASLTMQYRALADLKDIESGSKTDAKLSAQPLLERFYLNQYDENVDLKNLVNYPPTLQPVPVKPLFFDLAWNYIQYPGQMPAVNGAATVTSSSSEVPAEAKPAKKGWFGFGR